MKRAAFCLVFATALTAFAQQGTFTGVITDSMCGADHSKMKITPDAKCVRDCAKGSPAVKFALNDGKKIYKLSDQLTPAQYAGQTVKVSGTLYSQTGIIDVKRIELAR